MTENMTGYHCVAQRSHRCCLIIFSKQGSVSGKICQLIQLTAAIFHIGSASMYIYVGLKVTDPTNPTPKNSNRCFIIYEAVMNNSQPVAVPAYVLKEEPDMHRDLIVRHAKESLEHAQQ